MCVFYNIFIWDVIYAALAVNCMIHSGKRTVKYTRARKLKTSLLPFFPSLPSSIVSSLLLSPPFPLYTSSPPLFPYSHISLLILFPYFPFPSFPFLFPSSSSSVPPSISLFPSPPSLLPFPSHLLPFFPLPLSSLSPSPSVSSLWLSRSQPPTQRPPPPTPPEVRQPVASGRRARVTLAARSLAAAFL